MHEEPNNIEQDLQELKVQFLGETLKSIRAEMKMLSRRSGAIARDLQRVTVKIAVIEARAAVWGAAGAAAISLGGLVFGYLRR